MTAQPLSAGELSAGSAQPGLDLHLNACRLVDLREWLHCGLPVMQLHPGPAEPTSLLPEPSSIMEFFRLHTLLSCLQQGLLAIDETKASENHLEQTPVMIVPHKPVNVLSSWTQQEEASKLCMYAAAYVGTVSSTEILDEEPNN
ncbi:hypothetical protein ABBQ32_000394 [Trebouxia sp. C0010 RCD-2024]